MVRPISRALAGGLVLLLLIVGGALFVKSQPASARTNIGASTRASAPGHSIGVNGHGEIEIAPDTATLQLGVQTQGADAQTAMSKNATAMAAVIAAIKAEGVSDSHIQTSQISLWYDSDKDRYNAEHQLTVRVDDVTKVGAVLDAAVGAGANNSWGVTFGLKNPLAARADALKAAIADARVHADAMASALDVSITGVSSASEAGVNQPIGLPVTATASGAPTPPSTQVQPGTLTITADVNVIYTFG